MKKQKFILTAQRLIYIILTLSVATMLILLPNVVLSEETITWELYAREMRMQEEASGFYVDWNITDKEALIEVLIQMGALRETAATRRLLEEDFSVESRHALADQIMLQLLGGSSNPLVRKDGVRAVRWNTISTASMGDPSGWTLEEKVWYQQLENMFGHKDRDTLILPEDGDLPENEAVKIASNAIVNAYSLSSDALDRYIPSTFLYMTENDFGDHDPRPDYHRWNIRFFSYEYGNEPIEKAYSAIVDENGHIIGDYELGVPHVCEQATERKTRLDHATPEVIRAFRQYAEEEGTFSFWQWDYVTKAAYSNDIRAKVLSVLDAGKTNALINPSFCQTPVEEIIHSTVFAYGLPEEEHLQFENARVVAQSALTGKYGFSEAELGDYSIFSSFDVTDEELPLWKLIYCPDSFENMEEVLLYKFELNAYSGEITAEQIINWDDLWMDSDYERVLY